MEQIIAFVLGIVIVALPIAVVVVFKTRNQVNKLTTSTEDTIKYIDSEISDINFILNQEVSSVNNRLEDINKRIDSKTDRIESRSDTKINDLVNDLDRIEHAIEKLQYQLASFQSNFENKEVA